MRTPDLSLAGMPSWHAFAVYGWRRNGGYLYVGVTSKGYRRPFCRYEVIDRIEHVDEGDYFDFWFFVSREEAERFEAAMITFYHPSYNRFCPKNETGKRKARYCTCGQRIPKGYIRLLCGNCERLRALRIANKTIRTVTDEWALVHESPRWSDKWDSKYTCEERECARCKARFMQKQWWQSFCSAECETPPNLLGLPDTVSPLCETCKQERVPLFEGNCLDCLTEEQQAEFDSIMSQFKIVRQPQRRTNEQDS